MDEIQPDHEGLNAELSREILGLRAENLALRKSVQVASEQANSANARYDEIQVQIRQAMAAAHQANGDLLVEREKLPPLIARVQKLEGDLRFVADVLEPIHLKVQSLRPE